MPSNASTTTVCRRHNRRSHPSTSQPTAREPAAPESLGLDGAVGSRRLKRKQKHAMSGRPSKRRGASPFDGATSDDNRRTKNNGPADRKKPASSAQSIVSNGKDFKSRKFAAGGGNTRSSQATYEVDYDAFPTGPLLPFATSIYDQLRSDGIYPPKWPANITNAPAMAKLREDHKIYRERARECLINANLVDAPGVQKRLEDALVFKGVCENMCPEMEMITRIIEPDIPSVEKSAATGVAEVQKMIKKLARSAAGQETPLPMDVLSVAAMRRTLNYLVDILLRSDDNLPVVHGYLWDRTRALRRDFTFHSEMCAQELTDQVYCYENIIRFHVTALHLLSQKGVRPEEFSEQQELEQLSKTLMSLMSTYETCEAKGVFCQNESEFRAYYGIFFASSPDIQSSFQRGARSLQAWKDSDVIRTAVSLIEALQNTTSMHGPLGNSPSHAAASMHTTYFRIVESPDVSYTMACFAEIHFGTLRRAILQQAKKAFRRPKILSKDPTPALLNSFLRFDTDDEAVDFIEHHGLNFVTNEDAPNDQSRRYLDVTQPIHLPRIHHTFSSSLVERKRGHRPLPTVIHETVFEDSSAAAGFSAPAAGKTSDEESLFVDNAGFFRSPASTSSTKDNNQHWHASPFLASNGKPAGLDGANQANSASPFGNPLVASSSGALSTPSNPFSSAPGSVASVATPQSTTASPFGQPPKPVASASPFGQPARSPSPFGQASSAAPSGFGAPRAPSPFGQSNGQTAATTTKSPFGQPPSGFGQQKDTKPAESPFASANGTKPAASISPFGQAPSSDNAAQDTSASFKSPFAPAAAASTPASQLPGASTAPAPNPFATTTAKLPTPVPAETQSTFRAPASAPVQTSNASPFSAFAQAPAATKPPSDNALAGNSASKLFQPGPAQDAQPAATPSSSFPKPPAPSLSQNAPPVAAAPPFPSFGLPGAGMKTPAPLPASVSAPAAPTFTVTPPTPTFPPATTTAPTSTIAPPTTTSILPQNEPSMATKTTTASFPPAPAQQNEAQQPAPSLSTTFAPAPAQAPMAPPPPQPKQDLLGDFTQWFVKGDGGLLQEFQDFMVEDLLKQTFDKYISDEKERKRQEEEASDLAKAREFQIYNLRVKFFYRWRRIARALRLRRLRAKDKADYRAYMAAKHGEQMEAKKQAKKRAEAEKAALERGERVDSVREFRDFLQSRTANAEHEEALVASGILSGVVDEHQAASKIVRGDFAIPRIPAHRASARKSLPNGDGVREAALERPPPAGGAKTRALREQLNGGGKSILNSSSSSTFRRSLPPGSIPSRSWRVSPAASDSGKRISKVSDRWRLKAMGLATMPDGTALPEALANSMRYDGKRYEGWGSFGLDGQSAHRRSRSTSTDIAHSMAVRNAFVESFRKSSGGTAAASTEATTPRETSPSSSKRKRSAEDEASKNGIKSKKLATGEDSIERILREARELRGSLRSSRADLDETTGWFKEQSEMMQQDEMLSRRSSSNWGRE